MKKVLLLSLSLALGFSAFAQNRAAQQRVAKNDKQAFQVSAKKTAAVGKEQINATAASFAPQTAKSVVVNRYDENEYAETMMTNYDLQSNSWCSNRMYQLPDEGGVGVVGTFSHQTNQSATDRGTGYNFYKDGEWQEMPEARVEPFRTGWPTICQYGERGEVMLSHAPLHCFIREVAGEGEWVDMGLLPDHPDGYPYDEDVAWPRIATTGDNHNIIHMIGDLQAEDAEGNVHHHQVYYRSEDGGNSWITAFSPLAQDGEEADHYSADAYNISANGHTVAIIYGDDLQSHVVMYKSTDDGQTWTRYVIWENPYYGFDWATDPQSVFTDTLFGPSTLAIAVDKNGTAHVALSVYEYTHDEIGDTYTTYRGRGVDGIYYWNDTQGTIQDTYHPEYLGTSLEEHFYNPNPHHALRLWWPALDENGQPDGYVHMEADTTKWIGYVPMFEDNSGSLIEYDNDKFYIENDYFYKFRSSQSGMPALSIDPMGNIACAYSAPCTSRTDDNNTYYLRQMFVSYYNVDEGYWHQAEDWLTEDVIFLVSECMFTIGVDNTFKPGEFWFGFQGDDQIGLYWGSNATQTQASENIIYATKLIPAPEMVSVPENHEAINPMTATRIYPNPVVDQMTIEVNASQASDMSISVYNLMGQKVMDKNVSLNMGINTPTINTSNLSSGVYFVTVKANGFENTMKFIVK